ncbi:MAG: TRAP transporter large permease [Spirochaetes bacterium]|nr:TRAP transporter large permease [Spirochaetota bacterium]
MIEAYGLNVDAIAISILLGSFFLLLFLKLPITFSILISAFATGIYIDPSFRILSGLVLAMGKGITNFSLLAIPFFILAGQIMGDGGITRRIIDFSNVIIGRFRGGLAQVNVLASMFFGGISGSAVADVSSIGVMLIPMMKKKGYHADFSVAVTVSSACQGVLIPPSHNMIIYSFAAGGLSVGRLFLGGMIPGIMLGVALMVYCAIISIIRNYPKEPKYPFKEALSITLNASLGLFTFVIIMGGVILGVFTASESAAIASVYAFIVAFFIYKELSYRDVFKVLYNSLKTLAVVMSLIAAASAYSHLLAWLKVPELATRALLSLSDNRVVLILLINILLLILGCIMDMAPLILIVTPILYPVMVGQLGMDPVHFGIMLIFNLAIGLCTPPVGSALFVGCAVGKISIVEASKGLIPFYIAMLVTLVLITFVPFFSMFMPNLIMPELVAR